MSWNIDCLNPENKIDRVQEVCAILLEAEEHSLPDVILFQVCFRRFLYLFSGILPRDYGTRRNGKMGVQISTGRDETRSFSLRKLWDQVLS